MKKIGEDSYSFFCFTPEVMLATFIIEFSLAVYAYIRWRTTLFGKLAVLTLLLLSSFQFAEFQICAGNNPIFWARLGFVVITLLPPLGIHLVALATGDRRYVRFAYALAAIYGLIFAFAPRSITGGVCTGNYIIFNTAQELYWTYGVYYFGLLFLGIWEIVMHIRKNVGSEGFSLLLWMILGYFSFMIPMGLAYFVFPETAQAVASVMCGFALTFAIILTFVIAKKYDEIHKPR